MVLLRGAQDRLAIDVAPEIRIEAAELLLNGKVALGVVDRAPGLGAVADDAGVLEKLLNLRLVVGRDNGRIEVVEGAPVTLAPAEDGDPAQTSLRPFEDEH